MFSSKDCLRVCADELKRHNIENFQQETEILLSEFLGLKRLQLYLEDFKIEDFRYLKLRNLIEKRCRRWPVQYLINKVFFYGLEFKVYEGVFIPRPETEILVESVLNIVRDNELRNPQLVDIGTGCGNIAITLTKYLAGCKMMATDISKRALEIAKYNARSYKLENKINFLEGNLFEPLELKERADIIVSNPPYVNLVEMDELAPEVRKEPALALFGGEDGLLFYKKIIKDASLYLKSAGFLIMELADNRKSAVKDILINSYFKPPIFKKDYNGIDRVLIAQKG